jgi:hypothetical protein
MASRDRFRPRPPETLRRERDPARLPERNALSGVAHAVIHDASKNCMLPKSWVPDLSPAASPSGKFLNKIKGEEP